MHMTPIGIPQPKIVLEGTHLTRKTDVAFALAEHRLIVGDRKRRWHIPLISSEWETRSDKLPTKAEPGWNMIDFPPTDEAWARECYETYVRLLELHRDYYWIVDRFHISTVAHQRIVNGRELDLGWVDRRLAALGFVIVHCHRSPDTFEAAREHRLTYSENQHRYRDLDAFITEQEVMANLVASSAMRSMTVDVSDGDVERIALEILDWVRHVGAFWKQ
jgi:hypothetical protein